MSNRLPPAWSKHLKVSPGPKITQSEIVQQNANPPPRMQSDSALLRQALEFQKADRLSEAEEVCHRVLARTPEHPLALYILGTLGLDFDPELAINYFERAVVRDPGNPYYHLSLGEAWFRVGDFSPAIKHLERACELKPDLVEALCRLAQAYTRFDKAELALPVYEHALRINRDHPLVRQGMARTLIGLGRMDEAEAHLREAINRRVDIPQAYYTLVNIRKFSTEPPELKSILNELGSSAASTGEPFKLHFAAAKILNDLGRHEDAMEHFLKAAEIKAYRFDISSYRKRVDTLIELFDPELLAAKAGFGNPSEVPVFVLGMPRSGTTLTEQICSSHPNVHGAGELTKLGRIATGMGLRAESAQDFPANAKSMTLEQSRGLAGDYIASLRQYSDAASLIVDKMPHNFELVGLIGVLFPNAKIIHCRRNAIDNCISCFVSNLSDGHKYSYDLKTIGLYYHEYDRLMRHWKNVFPGRIFENRYEDLISDQEGQSRRLIDYLGLPWDDACLRFFEKEGSVRTISRWQVRQPIYTSSVGRWKNYGSKVQPLIDALGDLAER